MVAVAVAADKLAVSVVAESLAAASDSKVATELDC